MNTEVTFSCGHTGWVQIYGRPAERERRVWYYENHGLCPECYKKQQEEAKRQREEEARMAKENADAFGLPTLAGSEKQVAWAITIRQSFIDKYQEMQARYEEIKDDISDNKRQSLKELLDKYLFVINTETSAVRWIDRREYIDLKNHMVDWYEELAGKVKADALIPEEAKETVLLDPEEKKHDGLAVISVAETAVTVAYEKNSAFREIVKDAGFSWDAESVVWRKTINAFTGSAEDRAADIGNRLLRRGFRIEIPKAVSQMAVDGRFTPEVTRWIKYSKTQAMLVANWAYGDEDAYHAARSITGSRYQTGEVYLPVKEFDSVLDMAESYHFGISEGAQKAIDEYRSKIQTVAPEAPAAAPEDKDPKEILNSSREVIEDLKDD